MKQKITTALEKFSKAMLSPLNYIAAAGMILVLGALLTSSDLQKHIPFLTNPIVQLIGKLIYEGVMVIINNLSVFFCVGIASVMAKKDKHQAAMIALMSYLIFLKSSNVTLTQMDMLAVADPLVGLFGTGQATTLGMQVMDMSVFGGITLGLLNGFIYNKTRDKRFKGYVTQIFSGVRWSFTIMVFVAILMGVASCYIWPPVQGVIDSLTGLIKNSGNFGLFLYGFLERFLIPTGLHHLVYTPFQFSELGNSLTLGDTTYAGSYIVLMMENALGMEFSDGIVWMYTGFTKTFGYFGIVAAFIFCANKKNRAKTAATLIPLALTASLASITEPLDFLFCFAAPVLWVAHACIAGLFIVLLNVFQVTGFTTNLIASVLMNVSAGVERTNYPVLYLLALAQIVVYFVVFTLLIKKLNLKTPGREVEAAEAETLPGVGEAEPAEKAVEASHAEAAETSSEKSGAKSGKKTETMSAEQLQCIIDGLGGKENINTVDNCFTRLRVNVKDAALVNDEIIDKTPNSGIVKKENDIQIIFGLQVPEIKKAVEELL